MDGYEIYAGKRVAGLKIQFLQHEYKWSNHCITGNTLGWGITASSIPKSKTMLKELEKLAADIEPDRLLGIPVEEMIYSPATGFVRLSAIPLEQGEDQRNNKLVRMLQAADPGEVRPAACFAGLGILFSEEKSSSSNDSEYLPRLTYPSCEEDVNNILKTMNLYDRLPVFLRAVFWCLLEYRGGLNIVAPQWEKKDFTVNSARLMYAVHSLLPESLRKKAGYRSFVWKETEGISFYFSMEPYGRACFDLRQSYPVIPDSESDELSHYFYEKLAAYWKEKPEKYLELMERFSSYLSQSICTGHELEKIQWIFYDSVSCDGEAPVSLDYIAAHLPELMYWGDQDEAFQSIADHCLSHIHAARMTEEQEKVYLTALIEKVSKRSIGQVCGEISRILCQIKERAPKEAHQELLTLKEKNSAIYKGVKSILLKKEGWSQEFRIIEKPEAGEDKNGKDKNKDNKNEENKNKENKNQPDKLNASGNRRENENQAESGSRRGSGNRKKSDRAKITAKQEKTDKMKTGIIKTEAAYRVLEELEEDGQQAASGPFSEFLLTGLPIGFLTGCVMFLSHYSLMIGHWKIAVGMGGMWLILILNYIFLLRSRRQKRPLWMSIGFCLLEGELMEIVAFYFVNQRFRLYFFIVLGVLAAAVQTFNIIRSGREEKNDTSG